MALFGLKKKDRVLDLTEKYRKKLDTETAQVASSQVTDTSANALGFFGDMATAAQPAEIGRSDNFETSDSGEKKRRLAKRLMDMTDKLEDLSNQIYHLQQRVEVLERKTGVRVG